MKQTVAIVLCIIMILSLSVVPASARTSDYRIFVLDDFTVVETTYISDISSYAAKETKEVERSWELTSGSDAIADITIRATFEFDGSVVKVVSKQIVQCTTYNGWSFSQTGFTSSGGTVTLNGKLTKLLKSNTISLSLSCDKDGNIS